MMQSLALQKNTNYWLIPVWTAIASVFRTQVKQHTGSGEIRRKAEFLFGKLIAVIGSGAHVYQVNEA
jgi:uncharacterized protein with ACT and thioredoxin-like domain